MNSRDFTSISKQDYDLCIIGGGIFGATAAWEGARMGLKVILLERGDFGSETSSACFRIVHGGLRYLQHLNLKRLRQSAEEQRNLRLLAPHLVHPLPFLVPCYGYGMKGREALDLACNVYEGLTRFRNEGVPAYHKLPNHRMLTQEEVLAIAPDLNPQGLRGGAVFYDCQMWNSDRLTLSFMLGANQHGATTLNYAEVIGFVTEGASSSQREIKAVKVKDTETGLLHEIRVKSVLNSTGPWTALVGSLLSVQAGQAPKPKLVYSKGIQLVTKGLLNDFSLSVSGKDRRAYFFQPWRGHTLIGTTDSRFTGNPDTFSITLDEIRNFLDDVRASYPSEKLLPINVCYAFGGLRPIASAAKGGDNADSVEQDQSAKASNRDQIFDHGRGLGCGVTSRISNMVSVEGVKYTTARAVSASALELIAKKLSRRLRHQSLSPLPGGDIGRFETFIEDCVRMFPQLPAQTVHALAKNYGTRITLLQSILEERPELSIRLNAEEDVIAAEIVLAAREEAALRLEDVVFRRTGLGSLGFPGEEGLQTALRIMSEERNWSQAKAAEELEATKKKFSFA